MIGVIAKLLTGDPEIAERFAASRAFWDEFHAAHREEDEEALARSLGNAQSAYEATIWNWNRYLAKETMPWLAVATLYDEAKGFEDNRDYAARLLRAFNHPACTCSSEVKSECRDVAMVYHPEG